MAALRKRFLVTLFLQMCMNAVAAPSADRIAKLPDYGKPPTPQYSGFLKASPGTHLHYWFAETSNPKADTNTPVVLWLNGGPGSSSILGMLQEHGPLLINTTGGLMDNPYAWTNLAHLLVLESPAGVGYSYCTESLSGKGCNNTDKSTAIDARLALVDFFEHKFPEHNKRPFFITGESYAGVYVPTLAKELLDHAKGVVNLRGLGVGDPCTDNDAQRDSMDMLWYGHKYGFVPDSEFEFLWKNCSQRFRSTLTQGRWTGKRKQKLWSSHPGVSPTSHPGVSPMCKLAQRKFLISTSKGFSQDWSHAWINDLTLYGPSAVVDWDMPGSLNYMCAAYMMRADVRKALHVENGPMKSWPGPSDDWSYTSDYAACNDQAAANAPSMVDFYREIAPKLQNTVVYNGDTDPCVSYEGTRTAIQRVGFPQIPGGWYRPWFYNHTAVASLSLLESKPALFGPDLQLRDTGVQFGGHVVSYIHNLSFITVHGSGHMVPQFRPQAALHMLSKILGLLPFSPALPEKEISRMNDSEFDTFLDQWTVKAETKPYV